MNRLNDASVIRQQYAKADNLNTRISIHSKYSTNKMGFGNWIVSNYRIDKGAKVLEIGCGTGDMWKNRESLISDCSKLILSDFSEGMLATAKDNVGSYDNLEYRVIDIQEIPYENEIFDVVIANMMLYHVPDIDKGLAEVRRVLKRSGKFYCATYGENGTKEYLAKILPAYGVEDIINNNFTLQNGYEILSKYFSHVEKVEYIDSLAVTNMDDMVEYIYSLPSMTSLKSVPKQEIKDILLKNTENGILNVPKQNGMFISSMEQIELIEPEMKYADDIWEFRREILECDEESEDKFAGCLSLDVSVSVKEWIVKCKLRKSAETCSEAGVEVPSDTYLAVRKKDNKVIGIIDLRHHINHPILGTWGGHCGYSVRPSERGKGYAKEMLRLNILNAKALGIPKLLITCNVKNNASEKTILANGGVYEKIIDVDGCKMKRYWITVED